MFKEISQILNYSPIFIVAAIFLLGAAAYWKKKKFGILIWLMIGFHLALALAKSILQYWVWNQSELTRLLLHLPLDKSAAGWFAGSPVFTNFSRGYFLFYSWNHFWKEALLSIAAAFAVYKIFQLLRKLKGGFIEEQEAKIAFLMFLLVGWPQAIFLLPFALILAVIFSLVRWFYKREAYSALAWPLIAGAAILIVFNSQLAAWRFLIFNF